MDIFLVIVLPLVFCAVFIRNHLFAALICVGMLVLGYLNMTVMLFKGAEVLLIILAVLFSVLFAVEKIFKPLSTKTTVNLGWILGIVRYPANFLYLGDIMFRLMNWVPISGIVRDQPSLGAGISSMLEIPLMLSAVLGSVLLLFYVIGIVGAK